MYSSINIPKIKYHKYSSDGNKVVPRKMNGGETERHTNVTQLTVAFKKLASGPKNRLFVGHIRLPET